MAPSALTPEAGTLVTVGMVVIVYNTLRASEHGK